MPCVRIRARNPPLPFNAASAPGTKGPVHPVTRLRLFSPGKGDPLNGKLPQTNSRKSKPDTITLRRNASTSRSKTANSLRADPRTPPVRKSDLPFVIRLVIQIAVASQTAARQTLHFSHFKHWLSARFHSVPPHVIVRRRYEDPQNPHRRRDPLHGGVHSKIRILASRRSRVSQRSTLSCRLFCEPAGELPPRPSDRRVEPHRRHPGHPHR